MSHVNLPQPPESEDRRNFRVWLSRRAPGLDAAARDRVLTFGALIAAENPRLGLIAPNDVARLYGRHLQECLAPELLGEIPHGARVLDVGSGAGLPGLAIAIARPDIRVLLAEPKQKRAGFLDRAVLALGVENALVTPRTVEEVGRRPADIPFDVIVSRGIRWTPEMLVAARRLVVEAAVLLRFGAVEAFPGVRILRIDSPDSRAVQVWPRETWDGLPDAR